MATTDSGASRTALSRRLGAFDGALVVVASMIGSGIFTAAGYAAGGGEAFLPSPVILLLLWLLGGVYSLCGALAYAELATRMPEAGGEYVYLREAYGRLPAFLTGWISFVAGFSGAIAMFALSFVRYLSPLVPSWNPSSTVLDLAIGSFSYRLTSGQIAAAGVIALTTLVHCRRLSVGILYQNILTALKVAAVTAFVLGGLFSPAARWEAVTASTGGSVSLGLLAGCFAAVLFSYSGWNAVGYLAEEMRNPARTIAKALLAGTLLVTVLYLAINLVYVLAIPLEKFGADEKIAHRAAAVLVGGRTARLFAVAFGVLLLATLGANVLTGPRVYFSMARDGLFPWWLCGGVNKWGVPQRAVVLQGSVAVALLLAGAFETLLHWVAFLINVFATLAVLSVVVIRKRQGPPSGFSIPLYPLPVVIFAVISVFFSVFIYSRYPDTSRCGLGVIALGVLLYAFWRPGRGARSS